MLAEKIVMHNTINLWVLNEVHSRMEFGDSGQNIASGELLFKGSVSSIRKEVHNLDNLSLVW